MPRWPTSPSCRRCPTASPRCGRSTPSASGPAGAPSSPPTSPPQGVPTAIYYPKALHQQQAYQHFPSSDGGLAVTERLVEEVIALPMHGYLDEATQGRIIEAVRRALA